MRIKDLLTTHAEWLRMEGNDQWPKSLYEVFIKTGAAPMHCLSWDELPPVTQDAWQAVWEQAVTSVLEWDAEATGA